MHKQHYMSAENHYLDAVEALDSGDRETALTEAYKAVKLDPDHVDAWQIISDAHLSADGKAADLTSAAKSLTAVKMIVKLEPTRIDMWVRGGRLLADELGLMFDALDWWQQVRHHAPDEVTPLIEQATILADLGMYKEGKERIQTILNENTNESTRSELNELKKSLVITTGDNYVGAAKKQLREKMSDLYSKVASSYDKPSANELENLALIENEMKSANKRYSKILKKVNSTLIPEKSFEDFINE